MKNKNIFICKNCGYDSPKWLGKCPNCNQWNTFIEETIKNLSPAKHLALTEFSSEIVNLHDISNIKTDRIKTNIKEFDRILGGGIVPGSIILLGGQPGIGKSTLMLQVVDHLLHDNSSNTDLKALYVSGEESLQQIKLRADRLEIKQSKNFYLVSETILENILSAVNKISPNILIIDSIQTTYRQDIAASAGSVSQVRECSQEFLKLAKSKNITVFLLGHVTKEGDIAGPRILEHIVDTVLYFETEKHHTYRILCSYKNRFGPTSEIGVFEMTETGLKEIDNPSKLFLSLKTKSVPGSCLVCSVEGTRPIILEMQALVTRTLFGLPRRMVTGIDYNRVILLVGVLEKRTGLGLSSYDVFVNIAGGIKVKEPAVDLGTCIAIHSAYSNIICQQDSVYVGEVGLTGEIRGVSFLRERLTEIEKMGFKNAFIPKNNLQGLNFKSKDLKIIPVETIDEIIK